MNTPQAALRQLAQAAGLQTGYVDVLGRRHRTSPDVILAALNALGITMATIEEAPAALRMFQHRRLTRRVEPTIVLRPHRRNALSIFLPLSREPERFTVFFQQEDGTTHEWSVRSAELPRRGQEQNGTDTYSIARLGLPALPMGYHTLSLHFPDGIETTTHILCAPVRCWLPSEETRWWGLFLPLYALTTEQSWDAGNFSDLGTLVTWVAEQQGHVVGTLPLLDTYLDQPFDPSPYAPVSRLFWNPFYLDLTQAPEVDQCPEAQTLLASSTFQDALAAARASAFVDYRRGMQLRTQILQLLADSLAQHRGQRFEALQSWLHEHPEVEKYARFRAFVEQTRQGWQGWPTPQRDGQLGADDADPAIVRRFCYAQWLTEQQFLQVARSARAQHVGLYLDLPIGVHTQGYDTWRWRTNFALDMSAGAPPDAFYPEGQVWNFPPLHPLHTRENGHAYFRAIVRRHLAVGQLLRLDHVMGLHRLYWVPQGASGRDGIYVRYPAEELFAVLAIESQRAQAVLIGEDLGTVPWLVRDSMRRHHLLGMYILPFEQRGAGFATPSPLSLAALNTHDLPPFAALWQSWTPRQRHATLRWLQRRGWLLPDDSANDGACRRALEGVLTFLATSPARILLANAEDLWLETEPQNRPGTGAEQPNWRHKARLPLEAWSADPDLIHVLNRISQLRTKAAQGKETR